MSVHPSGLTVLLGFADKLRLMTVLMDDFRYTLSLIVEPIFCVCACPSVISLVPPHPQLFDPIPLFPNFTASHLFFNLSPLVPLGPSVL